MVDSKYEPVDASVVPRFSDVATFLRTKRVEMSSEIDIGLVGVPFDIGLNYRGGPREGPGAVRHSSRIQWCRSAPRMSRRRPTKAS